MAYEVNVQSYSVTNGEIFQPSQLDFQVKKDHRCMWHTGAHWLAHMPCGVASKCMIFFF